MDREDKYYIDKGELDFDEIINESKADEQNLIDFAGDSLAKRFLSIKNRLKSPENDIYYWLKKSPIELEDRVNEIENTISKTKQKEIQKTEGAELVAEENGWKVYRIDSYEASCLYGKGTKWCTAATETSKHFNSYKKKGIKLYYFIKNNEKYALALYPKIVDGLEIYGIKSNYELYDATDKLITDFNQMKSLNLPEIPGVKLTFELLPTEIEGDVLVKVYPYNQGEFVIPNNVTEIGERAFSSCESLTSITIPNSVTSIGERAFYNCKSLKSITIPNSVTSIGESAFYGCDSLTSITIPNSVTSIGRNAFRYCNSLTSITIPNSVTSIGESAFSGCDSLTSITIPNSVTKIGNYAFYNCKSLKSITIPNSVTSIGSGAFYNCKSLKSIILPNSVTEISEGAFLDCRSLTSITIPNSVTSIGKSAFSNCPSLTIYAEATSKPAGWDADWNPNNRPVVWGYNQKTNESIEKKPTHVRFINKNEYDTLQKNGKITPIDTAMRWSGKKSIFTFPLSEYSLEEYFDISHYLNDAFSTDYSYAVLLHINENIKPILAEYDVQEVEYILDKELQFDVTNDGSSYLVPEVRLTHYSKDNVVEIKTISEIK